MTRRTYRESPAQRPYDAPGPNLLAWAVVIAVGAVFVIGVATLGGGLP